MTMREIVAAVLRRWYAVVAVLAAAVLLAFFLARDGGTFTSSTVVAFTYPSTTTLTLTNGTNDENLIAFAGTVANEINDGRSPIRYSSDDAPYYGAGVREGVLVGLPNAGNQWSQSFTRAEIEIQVVGRSETWVTERRDALVANVLQTAGSLQDDVSTDPSDRISVAVVPLTLDVQHVVASRSSVVLAFAAASTAGILAGCWLALVLDRSRTRRVRRTAAPGSLVSVKGAVT